MFADFLGHLRLFFLIIVAVQWWLAALLPLLSSLLEHLLLETVFKFSKQN